MFLLRFTFGNHRSFRDDCDLVLVQGRLRTARPRDGSWSDYTNRVAAVYGANASGKSGLVDALRSFQILVRNSARSDTPNGKLPVSPFLLDEESRTRPSTFVLDFVLGDVRHEYGVVLTEDAISEEWLYDYPTGKKRVLFDRDLESGLTFGRALKGGEANLERSLGPQELVLSKGALLRNKQLSDIRHQIVSHLDIAQFGEMDRRGRLHAFVRDLAEGEFELEDVRTMLKVADVGIAAAEVGERETDPQFEKILRAILKVERNEAEDIDDEEMAKILSDSSRVLTFEHSGQGDRTYSLPTELQSTGTLTWLSLAAPAISAIKTGGVLVVDELDASLHPHLAQVMILMFKDPEINPKHAQLIFTTHDTYFISPTSEARLAPGEVFFVEKGRDGASELYSLDEFPVRKDDNLSRRYLQGRYGAVPSVAPAFLRSLTKTAKGHEHDVLPSSSPSK